MKDIRRVSDGYDFHLDRREIVFFSMAFLLCFFLFFLLGVLYGRKLAEVDALSPRKAAQTASVTETNLSEKTGGEDRPAGTDEADRRRHATRARLAAEKPRPPKPAAPAEDISDAPLFSKGEGDAFDGEDDVTPSRRPPSPPPVSSSGGPGNFTVQVASFKERGEAEVLAGKLAKKGYDAFVIRVDLGRRRGVWHRVRIGRYETKEQAREQMKTIKKAEKIDAFVAPIK